MAKKTSKPDVTADSETTSASKTITIKPPRIFTVALDIEGTADLVINRFGSEAKIIMEDKQRAGSTTQTKRKRAPKDFERLYRDSLHIAKEGWYGIHCAAFRSAAISACRLVGFKMTYAKLSIFVLADGHGADAERTPLIRITKGEPRQVNSYVKNSDGSIDIRPRGHWETWGATVRVQYDADQFTAEDIVNLFARVGVQVGVGAGRPDSSNSPGCGWGTFKIVGVKVINEEAA